MHWLVPDRTPADVLFDRAAVPAGRTIPAGDRACRSAVGRRRSAGHLAIATAGSFVVATSATDRRSSPATAPTATEPTPMNSRSAPSSP